MAIAGRNVINVNSPPQLSEAAVVNGGTDIAIQSALDGLTASRTWKEKVVLRGSFVIDDAIEIPSYTIIEIQGSISSTDIITGTLALFTNADATNTDIEIHGGYLDMGKEASSTAIYMSGVTNLIIEGTDIIDVASHGISLAGCADFILESNTIENCGDDGISTRYSYNGVITKNRIRGGADNTAASSGIEIEDGCYDVSVTSNNISGIQSATTSAIHVVNDTDGEGCQFNLNVANNFVHNCTGSGIRIQNNKASVSIASMSADGDGTVEITTDTAHGLASGRTHYVLLDAIDDSGLLWLNTLWEATITDTDAFTINATATGTFNADGDVLFDVLNSTVVGNVIENVGSIGMAATRAKGCSFISNSIRHTGSDGFVTGTGCSNLLVNSNSISESEAIGISMFQAANCTVDGNVVAKSGFGGSYEFSIQLNACTYTSVSNNNCVGMDQTGSALPYTKGIYSTGGGTNTIFGNEVSTCVKTSDYNIDVTSGDRVHNNSVEVVDVDSSGAKTLNASMHYVELGHVTQITATAVATDHKGIFTVKAVDEPATTHTVTLSSGTWDGTNTIATFADAGDKLVVYIDDDGAGTILSNVGAVALS